ncbi:MAG: MFS transporter [Deltaproteobacteria bacterium]|nr:MFS transporter [Deltaproteobacteria bacterium]
MSEKHQLERVVTIVCLIIAGEAVFSLPFHVARFFRPTVLQVFDFTNTELGAVQAVYGMVAMLAYFPGGPLADRFPARRLLTGSLLCTSVGGLYFATFPGYRGMWLLFAYWGLTTILLFWAALIRATREWGGPGKQGRAYGLLDGGRGLFAALVAAGAVFVLQSLLPEDPTTATADERAEALRNVILVYTVTTAGAGLLCWFFVPEREAPASQRPPVLRHVGKVMRLPGVWLQAIIVVSAYVGYKGIDNYSLFAVQAYGMNEVEGAQVTAISAWVRPVAAVAAGLLGDRITASRVSALCFAAMVASYLWFGLTEPVPSTRWVLYANVLVSCAAVFGLRGVYFALFEEGAVPIEATGTAVGLVSVIGYTPDVFVALVGGWLLDRSPGVAGHQHFFLFLGTFAAIGLVASLRFRTAQSSLP